MTRLGIQLIVFGRRSGDDLPGVLADVKAAGYDGAEIGYRADLSVEDYAGLLRQAGLACCGFHTGYQTFTDLDELHRQAAQLAGIGGKYFMCSGVAERSVDGYQRSAATFEAAADALAEHGIAFCYHNHNWEFFDLGGGVRGMDILAQNSDPARVKFCLDVYWVACGGDDPAAFIRTHAQRAVYFHFKDGTYDAAAQKPLTFTELGRGQAPLIPAAEAAKALNPEWIVTEQDNTQIEPAESARISAVYARQTLGI